MKYATLVLTAWQAAIILFEQTLRAFTQWLDHEASVFIKDAVRPAKLRKRIMQVRAHLAKLEHKCSGELPALVGGDGFICQHGLGFTLGCKAARQAKDRAGPERVWMA